MRAASEPLSHSLTSFYQPNDNRPAVELETGRVREVQLERLVCSCQVPAYASSHDTSTGALVCRFWSVRLATVSKIGQSLARSVPF
jgi:hypothetical protein